MAVRPQLTCSRAAGGVCTHSLHPTAGNCRYQHTSAATRKFNTSIFHQPLVDPGQAWFARSGQSTHPNIHPLLRNSPRCPLPFHPRGHSSMTECFSKSRHACPQGRSLLLVEVTCKSCISSNEWVEDRAFVFSPASSSSAFILYVSNLKTNCLLFWSTAFSFLCPQPLHLPSSHFLTFARIYSFSFCTDHCFVNVQHFLLLLVVLCQRCQLFQISGCFSNRGHTGNNFQGPRLVWIIDGGPQGAVLTQLADYLAFQQNKNEPSVTVALKHILISAEGERTTRWPVISGLFFPPIRF